MLVREPRIFSPLTVPRLCDTIGRYMYLFKRLAGLSAGRFYRFEHIVTDSSGEVVAKSGHPVLNYRIRTIDCQYTQSSGLPMMAVELAERGIRTLDGLLTHTPLAVVRLRPQ